MGDPSPKPEHIAGGALPEAKMEAIRASPSTGFEVSANVVGTVCPAAYGPVRDIDLAERAGAKSTGLGLVPSPSCAFGRFLDTCAGAAELMDAEPGGEAVPLELRARLWREAASDPELVLAFARIADTC